MPADAGAAAARCPQCSSGVSSAHRYCPDCGAPLRLLSDDATRPMYTMPMYSGSSSSSAPDDGRFPIGTVLAQRYRIVGLLGRGGMGEVYRAFDVVLNQTVALKFLSEATSMNEASLARFRNEVRIARQVAHPNVCRVYDIGVLEGLHYLSMEYVDGEDLDSLLRRIGRLPQDKAIEITRRLCAGLAAAHERGVLHRDLKPANIMIDGRGQVRITDFGLAALAADVPITDLRSGTPAYMSPEQRSGREVTIRSDLYSLGMVLFEMFTGKRRTDTQSAPSELVRDLDAATERIILRCLETDPRNRPSSAVAVAMALPGGDPIAAAIAAGETPSPEMVAASEEKQGFSVRAAVLCFVFVVAAVAISAAGALRITLTGAIPIEYTPDALAFKARDMLREFGYSGKPFDSAYGFHPANISYLRYVARTEFHNRQARIDSQRPSLIRFWYRESPQYLQSTLFLSPELANSTVTEYIPPNTMPGGIVMELDSKGRLVSLVANPPRMDREDSAQKPVDWNTVLTAAGLDASRLMPVKPVYNPPVFADERRAWTGKFDDSRPDTVTVEAAGWKGRPVYFATFGSWFTPEPQPARNAQQMTAAFLFVTVFIAAGLVARRNLKLARGDRSGAWRLAGFFFGLLMIQWLALAGHVPGYWELYLLAMGVAWAAFIGGLLWVIYVAVEPYIRRHWPDALISWVRLLGGRWRDPLTASHILAGLTVTMAAFPVVVLLHEIAGRFPQTWYVTGGPAQALAGPRFALGYALAGMQMGAFAALASIMVLVLLRLVIRKNAVADAVLIVLMGVANSAGTPAGLVSALLIATVSIWLLRRFGWLAFLSSYVGFSVLGGAPFNTGGGYVMAWVVQLLAMVGVAGWAVHTIVTTRAVRA